MLSWEGHVFWATWNGQRFSYRKSKVKGIIERTKKLPIMFPHLPQKAFCLFLKYASSQILATYCLLYWWCLLAPSSLKVLCPGPKRRADHLHSPRSGLPGQEIQHVITDSAICSLSLVKYTFFFFFTSTCHRTILVTTYCLLAKGWGSSHLQMTVSRQKVPTDLTFDIRRWARLLKDTQTWTSSRWLPIIHSPPCRRGRIYNLK